MDVGLRAMVFEKVSRRARAEGRRLADWLSPDAGRARYRLGADATDAHLPYTLDEALRQQTVAALTELACLYVSRNRDVLGEETYDALLLHAPAHAAVLGPPVFAAPEGVESDTVRLALKRSATILPGLDAGVLLAWWGSQGLGRNLLSTLTGLFGQAVMEMRGSPDLEQTPCWVQIALFGLAAEARTSLRPFDLPGAVRNEIETALLLGLLLCFHLVHGRVRELHPPADAGEEGVYWTWAAMLSPRPAFAARSALASFGYFFPVDPGSLGPAGAELFERLDESGWAAAAQWLTRYLRGKSDILRRAQFDIAGHCLGEQVLDLFAVGLPVESAAGQMLREGLRARAGLLGWLTDRGTRKQRARALSDLAAAAEPALGRRLSRLADQIKRLSAKAPLKALALDGDPMALTVRHFMVATGERLIEQVAAATRARLSERTGRETDRDLSDLYDGGRLYRLAADGQPFLKVFRKASDVGHYFIDVKDFTRQTARLKEEVMADVIRREFYAPILALAAEHHHGLSQLADRGGIHLNNLLGDAVSLSGDVVSLVRITRRIRAHLDGYAAGLAGHLASADQPIRGLQAGSFISYGAAPSVVTFDDSVWGSVRVSIAEKINESARGTARSGQVLADVRARLGQQRLRRGKPDLALPFRVYVGQPSGLPIPAAEDLEIRAALARGDPSAAMAIYQRLAAEHIDRQLGRDAAEHRAGLALSAALYNAGDAISQAAFAAYRQARQNELRFADLRLSLNQLDPDLTERYAFFERELLIVAAFGEGPGRAEELYRYAGQVVFKGFEAAQPVGVWEILPPTDPVTRSLSLTVSGLV